MVDTYVYPYIHTYIRNIGSTLFGDLSWIFFFVEDWSSVAREVCGFFITEERKQASKELYASIVSTISCCCHDRHRDRPRQLCLVQVICFPQC